MAYIVKADIQGLLGAFTIPAHFTDPLIADAIATAQATIDAFTRQRWEPVTRYLVCSGDGTHLLSTLNITPWPLREIDVIVERYSLGDDWDTDGEVVDPTGYTISDSRRGVLREYYKWSKGVKNYRVKASVGKAAPLPAIKQAAVLLVREIMEPGHLNAWQPMYSERFADGYSYVRNMETTFKNTTAATTGHAIVDAILIPHRFSLPATVVGI